MKKIILLLVCTILLVGCNRNEFELYREATEKTDTINIAKAKTDIKIDIEFGEKTPEDLKGMKEINYSNDISFNKSESKKISRQYIGNETMGIDTVFYLNGNENYFKIPFVGKYIKLDEDSFLDIQFNEPPITEDTISEVALTWNALVNEDDVVSLGNEVVDTPEGEVKVKKLVVTFTDVQLKSFIDDVLDIVSKDEKLKRDINNYPVYNISDDEFTETDYEVDLDVLIKNVRDFMSFVSFDSFTVTTYIDIDDYIVNEEFDIEVSFKSIASNYVRSVSFSSFYQLYDIGEKIEFIYPILNENNTTTIELLLEELEIENYLGGPNVKN